MLIRFREKMKFHRADLVESSAQLGNPGCGWYHVYTFTAQPPKDGRPVEEEVWLDESCRGEGLALVLIDLKAFRSSPLSPEALAHIRRILEFFRRNGMEIILRFVYDTEGKGMEREPFTLSMVKRHMEQAGGVIGAYMRDILVLQGIFVGNWGEMHGSKFLDEASLWELTDTLYRVTEGKCFLAVRTPAQRRKIMSNPGIRPGLGERLGLFNDGIFGSSTDLGTYGSQSRDEAGEKGSWSRREELDWQAQFLEGVPNGGEILSGESPVGYRQAAEELAQMHVSYLNSIYHPEQLDYWRREQAREDCWAGLSGYEYIGRHLGYRFCVLDVTEKKGKELQITVENSGFGNLCREAECFLKTEDGSGREAYHRLDTDARQWRSGRETLLRTEMPGEIKAGSRLSLLLKRKSDGRILRFANQEAGDSLLLGVFETL